MTRARNSANLASQGNLFVDIANDRTGIGSVVPAQNLHVAGTAGFHADTTFVGDLYNATWDRSDNSLKFVDNAKIKFGTSGDLEIYHSGNATRMENTIGTWVNKNTGGSYVIDISGDFYLRNENNSETRIRANNNGEVQLYYDNSKKFETTAYGTNITGTTDTDGLVVSGVATVATMNVTGVLTYEDVTSVDSVGIITARDHINIVNDNKKLQIGASQDLALYHDGTNSRIHNATGSIIIRNNSQDSDIALAGNDGGTVKNLLYLDASENGRASFSGEVNIEGTNRIRFYHNTSGGGTFQSFIGQRFTSNSFNFVINNQQNAIFVENDNVVFRGKSGEGDDTLAQFLKGGAVNLYHDGNFKLGTKAYGINVTGTTDTDGLVVSGVSTFSGNIKIDDRIKHIGDEDTQIRFPAADTIQFETGGTTRVGITTRVAIPNHAGSTLSFGQLSVRTNNGGDPVCLYLGAFGNHPSATGLSTAIMIDNQNAQRSEIRFNNNHNGNWHDTPGNTQHLRLIWTAPRESSTTPEVCEIKPTVVSTGATGAFDGLRIKVTDNSNGLRDSLLLQYNNQRFYVNNSVMAQITSDGLGINDGLFHRGDTNTKIRFPAADTISFETAGSERLRIDSSGRLGLGTIPDTELHVKGVGAILKLETTATTGSGYIDFNDADENKAFIGLGSGSDDSLSIWLRKSSNLRFATNNTERLRIDSNGNVLLNGGSLRIDGTGEFAVYESDTSLGFNNSAQISLDFSSNVARVRSTASGSGTNRPLALCIGSSEALRIDTSGRLTAGATSHTSNGIAEFHRDIGGGAEGCHILVKNTSTNSVNNTARLKLETSGGTAQFYAFATNVTELRSRVGGTADWKIRADGASNMRFYTNDNERVRIDSDGVLKIERGSASDTALEINTTSTTQACRIGFSESGTRKAEIAYSHDNNQIEIVGKSGQSASIFTNGTERFRIDSSGSVRVGNSSYNANTNADNLIVGTTNSGNNNGISIISHTNSEPRLIFASNASNAAGMIKYAFSTNVMQFFVDGSEQARIDSNGNIGINDALIHNGDTDTKIEFSTNKIDLQTGGSSRIYADNFAVYIKSGFPLAFLPSSGPTPHIKSGGTNNQDILFTTGSGNPTRLQVREETNGQYLGRTPLNPAESALEVKNDVSGTPDNGWYYIKQFGDVARLHYCVFKDKNGSDIAGGPWTINWIAGVDPSFFSTNGSTSIGRYLNLCKGIGIDKPGRGMESSRTTAQVYGAWLAVKRAMWEVDPGMFNGATASEGGGVLIMPIMNINGEGGSSDHRTVYNTSNGTHIPPNQSGDRCNANQLFCGWWGSNDFSSWATDNNDVPGPEDWGPNDSRHNGTIGNKSHSTTEKPSWKDKMLVTCIYK